MEIERFADTHGLTIDEVTTDRAVSRSESPWDRAGLSTVLGKMKKGDCLLCSKLDRIGTLLEINLIQREFDRKGMRLLSVHGDNAQTPEAELLRNLLGSVSQFELRQVAARTAAGLRALKADGRKYCKRRYGYSATEDGMFAENPEEMAIVKRIQLEAELGYSLSAIASSLNADGFPAPLGGIWRHTTVRKIAQRASEQPAAA